MHTVCFIVVEQVPASSLLPHHMSFQVNSTNAVDWNVSEELQLPPSWRLFLCWKSQSCCFTSDCYRALSLLPKMLYKCLLPKNMHIRTVSEECINVNMAEKHYVLCSHTFWVIRSQVDSFASSHLALGRVSACVSSDHLWSDLPSLMYMQTNTYIISICKDHVLFLTGERHFLCLVCLHFNLACKVFKACLACCCLFSHLFSAKDQGSPLRWPCSQEYLPRVGYPSCWTDTGTWNLVSILNSTFFFWLFYFNKI